MKAIRIVALGLLALALALAVLAAVAIALWLGLFREERAAASPGPVDLSVVVSSDPASGTTMAPGSIISYTVTVTSDDVTAAAGGNITLTIDLSNATLSGSPSSADGITCSGTDPLDCQVPDFTVAGSKAVSFNATVGVGTPVLVGAALDPPIDGTDDGEVDEGTVSPDHDDDDGDDVLDCAPVGEGSDTSVEEPDNFDCTEHAVGTADLTITKVSSIAEGTTVAIGDPITYVLAARNAAGVTGTATNVVIRDYTGTGLTFVSATAGPGVTCTDTTPPIDCTVASLPPNQSATVVIVVSVAASSGLLLNGAYVDPDNAITETNEDADDPGAVCATVGEGSDAGATEPDNYDCTTHAAGGLPDLMITKAASPAETTTVATGGTITYTLSISNSAAATTTVTSVPIRDYIGSGLNFVSATPGLGVTCSDTTPPEINCSATSIAPGESRTVTIVATVTATSGAVLNGAYVDPGYAITEMNEDADDPVHDCGSVGEGTDAGDPTEADNYDCTRHAVAADNYKLPVPNFKQCDSPWGDDLYDRIDLYLSGRTDVCWWGCALTSAVDVLAYWGVSTTPAALNEWLNGQSRGYSEGYVNWSTIDDYAEELSVYLAEPKVYFDSDVAALRASLDSGHPVILGVPYGVKDCGHWVVAIGPNGDTWWINDPNGVSGVTLEAYGNSFNCRVVYEPESGSNARLAFRVHSPVELVITDPQGRRLGFDPNSSISYDEIPGGSYGVDGGIVGGDGSGETLSGITTAWLNAPIDGEYTVDAIGTDTGTYAVDGEAYDRDGNYSPIDGPSGTTSPGQVDSAVVEYTSQSPPVGGIAELPDVADSSGRNHIALAGLAAAALAALIAGAWYARRRGLG